ncbi:MAG: hypothetical protein GY909_15300 [Oligoflexia bacterium]|nr:hypothetical protein [Oligoflexia bacterium]
MKKYFNVFNLIYLTLGISSSVYYFYSIPTLATFNKYLSYLYVIFLCFWILMSVVDIFKLKKFIKNNQVVLSDEVSKKEYLSLVINLAVSLTLAGLLFLTGSYPLVLTLIAIDILLHLPSFISKKYRDSKIAFDLSEAKDLEEIKALMKEGLEKGPDSEAHKKIENSGAGVFFKKYYIYVKLALFSLFIYFSAFNTSVVPKSVLSIYENFILYFSIFKIVISSLFLIMVTIVSQKGLLRKDMFKSMTNTQASQRIASVMYGIFVGLSFSHILHNYKVAGYVIIAVSLEQLLHYTRKKIQES